MNLTARQIIDRLGGTATVAKIFDIKMSSISVWKKTHIPNARLMYLKVVYPHVFEENFLSKNSAGETVLYTGNPTGAGELPSGDTGAH